MARLGKSFRSRLLLLIVLVLAPTLGLLWAQAAADRDQAIAQVREDTLTLANAAAVGEQHALDAMAQVLASLFWLPDLAERDPAQCADALRRLNASFAQTTGLGLARPDGSVACSTRPVPAGFSVAGTTSFDRAVATRGFALGDFRINRITGEPTMGAGMPLFGPAGELRGVALATVDLEALGSITAELGLPPGYAMLFLDGGGTILTRQPDHALWVGKPAPAGILGAAAAPDRVAELEGLDGVRRIYAVVALPDGGVHVAVGAPVAAVIAPIDEEFARNVGFVAALGALAFAAALLFSERAVVRPLAAVAQAARRRAAGEMDARAGLPRDGSEAGEVGLAFDEMADVLDAAQAREHEARTALEAANRRLEELDRLRAQFVNVAAHELVNPLTPIAMQLEVLRGSAGSRASPEQARALDIVERNVARLGALTRDVLDAARLQAGALRMAPRPVDLAPLVAETVDALRDAAARGGVRLEAAAADPLPVQGDGGRLGQVLFNLVANAVKFTPPGGSVQVRARAQGGETVVEVLDTGRGFDPADAPRLFQPFTRLGDTATGPPGTGLGLYLSRAIVEQHGGRVWAVSPGPGRGAVFGFALPPARDDSRGTMPPAGEATSSA